MTRHLNRWNTVFLVANIVQAPDFQGVRGIYPPDGWVLNITDIVQNSSLLCAFSTYLYLSTSALNKINRQLDPRAATRFMPLMRWVYVVLNSMLFAFGLVTAVVDVVAFSGPLLASYSIVSVAVGCIALSVFIFVSLRLLALLKSTTTNALRHAKKKICLLLMVGTPLALAVFGFVLYLAVTDLPYSSYPTRNGDSYDPTYAIYLWLFMAVNTFFIYISWIPVRFTRRRPSRAAGEKTADFSSGKVAHKSRQPSTTQSIEPLRPPVLQEDSTLVVSSSCTLLTTEPTNTDPAFTNADMAIVP